MTNILISKKQFQNAQENMDFDSHQLHNCETTKQVHFRCYIWPKIGLTFSYTQSLPTELAHYDSGKRPTGGGVVFHAPGDIVFSFAAPIAHPIFPKALKHKLATVQKWIKQALEPYVDKRLFKKNRFQKPANRFFCAGYDNPYELYYNNQKICGLTIRKYRTAFLIQGILHRTSNRDLFSTLPVLYHDYFTQGLFEKSKAVAPAKIQERLLAVVKASQV